MKSGETPNRNDGKDFERRVFDLLNLKGAHNLTREKQLSSKKIDLYFETAIFGTRLKYAVECKDLSRTLSHGEIAIIYSEYSGLLKSAEITDLLVVSNSRLGPTAQSYVDSIP